MAINKLKTDFARYNEGNFAFKVGFIVKSVKENPFFSNPAPPLEEIEAVFEQYQVAFRGAQTGNYIDISARRNLRKELSQLLKELANYVMFKAKGDKLILESSGFELVKKPQRIYIESDRMVTLKPGISSGEMISCIKAVKGVRNYTHEILDQEPTNLSHWQSYSSSTCKFIFKELTPGKKYWIRVIATGSRGQKVVSHIVSHYCI